MVSTPFKNISQNGNLPQIGVKIKNIWNHHPDIIFKNIQQLTFQCLPSKPSNRCLEIPSRGGDLIFHVPQQLPGTAHSGSFSCPEDENQWKSKHGRIDLSVVLTLCCLCCLCLLNTIHEPCSLKVLCAYHVREYFDTNLRINKVLWCCMSEHVWTFLYKKLTFEYLYLFLCQQLESPSNQPTGSPGFKLGRKVMSRWR